jgi:hypothetical protein
LNTVITPNIIEFNDNPESTTVTFRENSVLTFDAEGDPNAIFVIRASNITFQNNVTIQLVNQAQHTNIFWDTYGSGTISFEGTNSSIFGVFIGSFVCNNLVLKGHIYTINNLTVNGRLNIEYSCSRIRHLFCQTYTY